MFTDRERQVMNMLLNGLTYNQIADNLSITNDRVKNIKASAKLKLLRGNVAEDVQMAIDVDRLVHARSMPVRDVRKRRARPGTIAKIMRRK